MTTKSAQEVGNDFIQHALEGLEDPQPKELNIKAPFNNQVQLPAGYIKADGEVALTAEVRELTGKDEEAIIRSGSMGKALIMVLNRGVTTIGSEKATEAILDSLLSADRDALLLGIFRATFGDEADMSAYCNGCNDIKTLRIDVTEDIPVKKLEDPVADRVFTVEGRKNSYTVELPYGRTQKELLLNVDKNVAELSSILLRGCVSAINGKPVYDKKQIDSIGVADRRTIGEAIAEKSPGPQLTEVKAACPDCGEEVTLPINFGTLFRF